jgi:GNAT superfamily N-acetyltransferase
LFKITLAPHDGRSIIAWLFLVARASALNLSATSHSWPLQEKRMTEAITVRRIAAADATNYAQALADVLIDCVEGGASVSFMLPLQREKALDFWRDVADGVTRGERALLVAEDSDGRVVGTVQLILAQPDNQPHRADVAKMLVRRDVRRRGIAQRLISAVDALARDEGKNVLVLDTVTGGDAERLYERAGWQRVGVVPKYALMPDGEFCATTFFYKHL